LLTLSDLQDNVQARQKLEAQQQENKGVQKEFSGLDESANIYKLVGPVLLKQDHSEAMETVNGRLKYIDGEIKRLEGLISEAQSQGEKKKMEVSYAREVGARNVLIKGASDLSATTTTTLSVLRTNTRVHSHPFLVSKFVCMFRFLELRSAGTCLVDWSRQDEGELADIILLRYRRIESLFAISGH
jgi:prefoldin beta subunit